MSWSHRLTRTVDFVAAADGNYLTYDDTRGTTVTIVRTTGGVRATLSDRLTINANGGAVFTDTHFDNPNGAAATTNVFDPITGLPIFVTPQSGGSAVGPVWDVGLTYKLTKTANFRMNASEFVSPGATGSLSNRTIISASLSQQINSKSSLNFSANKTHIDLGSTAPPYDFYIASAAYDYRLTRDLRASLAYSYRLRNVPDSATAPGGSAGPTALFSR